MKTYTVKPEGINPVRKRMLTAGVAFFAVVLAGFGLIMPGRGLTPFGYGVFGLFFLIFGGFGFRRGLRRMIETWPSYTLTVADDFICKQQSHYPDITIARNEVTAIWKSSAGEIIVKTRDWKKFISIPPSLIGLAEVEGLLSQWRPIKPYPRAKTFLSYAMAFLIPVAVIIAYRGYLESHALRPPFIFGAVLVIMIAHLFLQRMLRRFPNVDERSRPKRWQFYMTIVYILLFLISLAVFFGLKK